MFTQRGVALIAVTVALALGGIIIKEFSTNTSIDHFAAHNAKDDMKAHFLARSAMNLGHLIIRLQTDVMDKNREMLGDIQLADYTQWFMGAFCGGKDEVASIGEMLGGFAGQEIKGLGIPDGSCDIEITTDDHLVNLNCANGSSNTRKLLQTKLETMVYPPAFDRLFENADGEGYRRDRATQVAALIDYVDKDRNRVDAQGNPEDYGYESISDPYKAKDDYIDTPGEIRLVRGVDERFWNLWGHKFTTYGECKQNLGSMSDPGAIAAIISLSPKDDNDPVVLDQNKLWALARRVTDARALGVYFDDLDAFIEFVKNPDGSLASALGDGTEDAASAAAQAGLVPVEGVELDKAKLELVATTGPRRIYRVQATSSSGVLNKRIVGVWDTETQNQNNRDPQYGKGAWVFWREE
jgi:general secretion pathway protein K